MSYPPLESHRLHALPVYCDDKNVATFGRERPVNKANGHNKPFYGSFKPPSTEAYRGKENIDPMLTHMGDRNAQQQKYYYGFPSHTDNDAYGYSMNPLSYASSQPSCGPDHNKAASKDMMTVNTSDLFVQQTPGMFEAGHAASPDGTVSDIGHEDISQMYLGGLAE
ncbi:hypothetical protein FQN49_008194 [Arthroderma sp. PD_2]|nr:hypothetical protein FQN49_008194 [Arthroderma sp. PD_2]